MIDSSEVIINFEPQEGPQTKFLESVANIVIYGGAAGGGKSYALLLETLRHIETDRFSAVIFRRERPQITNPGGLWDESQNIFRPLGGEPRESGHLDWIMPSGMSLKFSHMQLESDKYDWMGSQIPLIGFDELTHFTKTQFFYMLSRNRSVGGSPGYMRGTCNADADSWVAEFIKWWIDQDTGLPIPDRDGVLRWFIRQGDDLIWADSKAELVDEYGDSGYDAVSVTFIASRVFDNKILLEKDPSYLAKLKSLDRVDRGRLLDGNWKIKAAAGTVFKRSDFRIVDAIPSNVKRWIRYWDRASTEPHETNKNPDWTVGVLMGITTDNQVIIVHVERFRGTPLKVETRVKNMAKQDGYRTSIGIEQDPGQAGEADAQNYVRALAGYDVRAFKVHKDKPTRAKGYSAQVEGGNVLLLKGDWNEAFLNEHENFPASGEGKDDQVDACSGGFNYLTGDKVGTWVPPSTQGTKTIAAGFARGAPQW